MYLGAEATLSKDGGGGSTLSISPKIPFWVYPLLGIGLYFLFSSKKRL